MDVVNYIVVGLFPNVAPEESQCPSPTHILSVVEKKNYVDCVRSLYDLSNSNHRDTTRKKCSVTRGIWYRTICISGEEDRRLGVLSKNQIPSGD